MVDGHLACIYSSLVALTLSLKLFDSVPLTTTVLRPLRHRKEMGSKTDLVFDGRDTINSLDKSASGCFLSHDLLFSQYFESNFCHYVDYVDFFFF